MPCLHKEYSISLKWGLTKKLIQQYVDLFCISEKICRLSYRLAILLYWKIHRVFSVAQLELMPLPSEDSFHWVFPDYLPLIFVKGETNAVKSFKVERLLDKKIVQKGYGRFAEYLVR